MVVANSIRAHGQTTAEEAAKEVARELDKHVEIEAPKPLNLTRAFQRMRLEWDGPNRDIMDKATSYVDKRLHTEFAEAFAIMNEIYLVVREPKVDPNTGELEFDQWGFPVYQKYPEGSFIEDWDNLTQKQIKHFIFKLITAAYEDEQKAANAWGRALFAKGVYEEAFSVDFDGHPDAKATVESRKARAEAQAIDYKYTAILESMYSRKADAIIKAIANLHQRLKDSLTQ